MEVNKSELEFLDNFVAVSGNGSALAGMVNIAVEGDSAHFVIQTDAVVVSKFLQLEKAADSFSVFVPVKSLHSMLKTLKPNDTVNIDKNVVSFKSGSYFLDEFKASVDLSKVIEGYSDLEYEEVVITEVDKISCLLDFAGGPTQPGKAQVREAIIYEDGYYASGTENGLAGATAKIEGASGVRVHIPLTIAKFISTSSESSVTIRKYSKVDQSVWMKFTIGDTDFFVPEKNVGLPAVSRFVEIFNVDANIEINRSDFKSVIDRLSIGVNDNDRKLFKLSFQDGNLVFESFGKSFTERFESGYPPELEEKSVLVSFDYFRSAFNKIDGDVMQLGIVLEVGENGQAKPICIKNETGDITIGLVQYVNG